jgi:exosome complex RNA-binding protein Csl4
MNQSFYVISAEEKSEILNRLASYLNEPVSKVEELYPVWETIILGGLLKLVRNRIRFNALYNFILQKSAPISDIEAFLASGKNKYDEDAILRYGEGMMGILIPDKKSAIAMLLSREMGAKSSSILKGLTLFFGLYGYRLKQEEYAALKDWKAYGDYFLGLKQQFYVLCPAKIQLGVSEILLLSDILRVDTGALLTYSDEQEPISEGGLLQNLTVNTFVYMLIILVLGAGVIWYTAFRSTESEEVVADTEEIIPIDSLSKLNDSLTRAVLDSTKLRSDSLTSLVWPKGTLFDVPKNSVVVGLHQYLSDSTQTDAIELVANEIQFNEQTDLLDKPVDYVFKRMAEGLNRYKEVSIKIVVNSDKDDRSSLKRGFVLKNRFVGEGLSPARIEVKTGDAKGVVFGISKKPLLK